MGQEPGPQPCNPLMNFLFPVPVPCSGATSVLVRSHSLYFGSTAVHATREDGAWKATLRLCDRVGDVTIQLLDADEMALAHTGFALPSNDATSQRMELPLVKVWEKDKDPPPARSWSLGTAPVSFRVTYEWKSEWRMMKAIQLMPETYLEPPFDALTSGYSKNIVAQLFFWVDSKAVVTRFTSGLDVLFWTKPARTGMFLGAACAGVFVVGFLRMWLPAVIAGLLLLLLKGREHQETYAKHGRAAHPDGTVLFLFKNIDLTRFGLARLWAVLWGLDGALQIYTWQVML